jgi:hypothetical protein
MAILMRCFFSSAAIATGRVLAPDLLFLKMGAAIVPFPCANALRLQLQAVAYNLQPDGPEVFDTSGPLANWIIRQLGYCSAAQQETRAGVCASSKAYS